MEKKLHSFEKINLAAAVVVVVVVVVVVIPAPHHRIFVSSHECHYSLKDAISESAASS